MKKTLAFLLVFVLMLSVVLVSCGEKEPTKLSDYDKNTFEGSYNTVYEDDAIQTVVGAATRIDLSFDYEDFNSNTYGPLFVLYDNYAAAGEVKYAVINMETGALVYRLYKENTSPTISGISPATITRTASIHSIGTSNYYVITEITTDTSERYNTKYTYTIYDMSGGKITSATKANNNFSYNFGYNSEGFVFEGKLYEVDEDGVITQNMNYGSPAGATSYSVSTETYNYKMASSAFYVYDAAGTYLNSYEVPADADDASFHVLANGNVLIQLTTELPYDAEEYTYEAYNRYGDVEIQDAKYKLTTLVYNAATGATNEVTFNHLVVDVDNEFINKDFAEKFTSGKFENIATLYTIENKHINLHEIYYMSMKNDLTFVERLGCEIPNQVGIATLVDTNRFIARDKAGNAYLLNERGEVIGDVTACYSNITTFGAKRCFYTGGKYYDMNLQLIYDSNVSNYTSVGGSFYAHTYALEDYFGSKKIVTDYYARYGETFTKIDTSEATTISNVSGHEKYMSYTETITYGDGITPDERYYVIVNTKGDEIFRMKSNSVVVEYSSYKTTTSYSISVSASSYGCIRISVRTIIETLEDGQNYPDTTNTMTYYIAK